MENDIQTLKGCGEMFRMGSMFAKCGDFWLCDKCIKVQNEKNN